MDKIINDTKGTLKKDWVLYNIPHSFISCPNLTISPSSSYDRKEFYSTYPVPLHFEKFKKLPKDTFSNIMMKKDKWLSSIESIKNQYHRSKTVKKLHINDKLFKKGLIPKYFSDFCTNLQQDPDIYFQGTYNWYYTNGNLDSFEYDDKQMILHTTGSSQNILNVSSLNFNHNTDNKLVKEWSGHYRDSILELSCKNVNNNIFIYNRHKNNIFINKLNLTDNNATMYLETIHDNNHFKVPLISFAINQNYLNTYCTVDAKRSLKIWDIHSKKSNKIQIDNNKSLIDNWSYITYVTNSNLVYLDRQNISIIDSRAGEKQLSLIKNVSFDCDHYSIALPSIESSNHIYIGSNHSVFLLDIRSTKTIKKWTHMMNSVPFLMRSLINLDNYEILAISSPLSQEKSLILNSSKDLITSTPLGLKSLDNTIKQTNLNQQCLHPDSAIRNHINYSTTGMTMFINRVHCLLTQNSLGDLYIQKFAEHPTENDSIFTYQSKKRLNKKVQKRKVQDVHCMSMAHLFTKTVAKKYTSVRKKPLKESWRRSIQELKTYNDVLCPLILQGWGYITEGEVYGDYRMDAPKTPNDKVTLWLADVNCTENLDDFQTTQETIDTLNLTQSQQSVFSQINTPQVARKAIKRKRISGF